MSMNPLRQPLPALTSFAIECSIMSGSATLERPGKVRRIAGARPCPPQSPFKKQARCSPSSRLPSRTPSDAVSADDADARHPPAVADGCCSAPADVSGRSAVVLEACKFISKRSKATCTALPSIVCHKRGHLAVSCSAGHQVPLPSILAENPAVIPAESVRRRAARIVRDVRISATGAARAARASSAA